MTVSRNRVEEIIEFFDMTGRKCVVIWERTIPTAKKPTIEISSSIDKESGNFFRAAAAVLAQAATDLDSIDEEDLGEDFSEQ